MTQDMNHTFVKTLKAVLVAAMMLLTSSNAMADGVVVKGNVYGGGNLAPVGKTVTVNIKAGQIGDTQLDANHGNVYGGGALANTNTDAQTATYYQVTLTEATTVTAADGYYNIDANNNYTPAEGNLSAGTYYRKNETIVNLTGGEVKGDVYGGGLGRLASGEGANAVSAIEAKVYGEVTVNVNGGEARNVFGCNNLNGAPQQQVIVNIKDGTVNQDVYGGGNQADAPGKITVNIEGGTVKRDVYGGGALASTNIGNWDDTNSTWSNTTNTSTVNTTNVNLINGVINGNVYGGGLGKYTSASDNVPAKVYGDVTVELNKADTLCVVQGSIFGCNNVYGSPQGNVTVYVYGTKGVHEKGKPAKLSRETYFSATEAEKEEHRYDLKAVYGGGNKAAYTPVNSLLANSTTNADKIAAAHTNVIIDGCDRSSIWQVYGGGNAASTPGTSVTIKGTYEIGEVFGGGNGANTGEYSATNPNPGANVGYAADNSNGTPGSQYGSGKAQVNINGGLVHSVFGGSNTKGNVREVAVAMLEETKTGGTPNCPFVVDEAYGGGKSAQMDGEARLQLGCIPGVGRVYGGAMNADVKNNVNLRIENGVFNKVYGGNNLGGRILGSITVEVEEIGCTNIEIDELYGGGNQAGYSVYGYKQVTEGGKTVWKPRESASDDGTGPSTAYANPQVNIISSTRIGKVFGGGDNALMVGEPHVTINMVAGVLNKNDDDAGDNTTQANNVTQTLGKIGQVFGGGNKAGVIGSPYVSITKGQIQSVPADKSTSPETLSPGVYGGCNEQGTVSGDTHVTLTGGTIGESNALAEICGGGLGKNTVVSGTAHVDAGSVILLGDIYGGSAFGVVNNTEVNLNSLGTSASPFSGNVYGGGKGSYTAGAITGNIAAQVNGTAKVNMNAAIVTGGIYGGCNINGTTKATEVNMLGGTLGVEGTPKADLLFAGGKGQNTTTTDAKMNIGSVNETTTPHTYSGSATIYSNVYGGSALGAVGVSTSNEVTGSATVNLYQATAITGDVFGDGMGDVDTDTKARMGNSTVYLYSLDLSNSNIYGGCNYNGMVYGKATVNLIGGSVAEVYGGGQGKLTQVANSGSVEVNVGTAVGSGTTTVTGAIYGGSAFGGVNSPTVNIYSATSIGGSVYGGGKGIDDITTPANSVTATVTGTSKVYMYGTTITHPIYGGCNAKGTSENTEVTILGGTLGIAFNSAPASLSALDNILFGGGKGSATSVTGTTKVYVGTKTAKTSGSGYDYAGNANIYGNVYGGSENGSVAAVDVKLYANTIHGNVFGGGYETAEGKNAATTVNVDLDGTAFKCYYTGEGDSKTPRTGQIFGCNNKTGSPTGKTEVHIYRTVHLDGTTIVDTYPTTGTYELAAVFGGGHAASYTATGANCRTEVHIESCDPTIEMVYGGGNAANVTNSYVKVNGAHEINYLFGGGNGSGKLDDGTTDNPGANVSGTAETKLYGGNIHYFYGGSNAKGTIGQYNETTKVSTGGTDITIDDLYIKEGTGCTLQVTNIYGAGKSANVDGGVKMTMGCLSDAYKIDNLYGGAQNANIKGDVVLTVTSGKFANVFGGNNAGGTIGGSIEVNIEETGCKPLIIENVYGGGDQASYTAPFKENSTTEMVSSPVVNLKSFTAIGNVYGGGKGLATDPTKGVVTGNPQVNINQVYGEFTKTELGTIGNVFGGGEIAKVVGNVSINIGTEEKVQMKSLDKREATSSDPEYVANAESQQLIFPRVEVKGVNIYSGIYSQFVDDENNPLSFPGNVYGGGKSADIQGDVTITIGTKDLTSKTSTDGKKGTKIYGNVFGGGLGENTKVTGNVLVNIGANTGTVQDPVGTGYALITGDVYGGSAKGKVNTTDGDAVTSSTTTTKVNLYGGTVSGSVYGGGYGKDPVTSSTTTYDANVYGAVTVSVYGGTATNVFGCNNIAGTPQSTVAVNINNTATAGVGNVYGGGNQADYAGSTTVTMAGGNVNYIYGGGLSANVGGSTRVNIQGGTVNNDVYGGGALAHTNTANWNTDGIANGSGTWASDALNTNGTTKKNTTVNLTGGTVTGSVYGGGLGNANTAAYVYGDVAVTLNGAKVANVFGCNNEKGTPKGHVKVHVLKTGVERADAPIASRTAPYDVTAVYGGGNKADYRPVNDNDYAEVLIEGCQETSIENVYGGGNAAAVPATEVTVMGAYIINNLYGGGNGAGTGNPGADVGYYEHSKSNTYGTGKAITKLLGGYINNVYGGSNTLGDIREGTDLKTKKDGDPALPPTVDCCTKLVVDNLYGAGSEADVDGDVVITLDCMPDDYVAEVYGGAENASINGSVTLTVSGGKFGRVFGGNNRGGTINGSITVNAFEGGCKPLEIGELYGGGNAAPYSIYGCTRQSDGSWTANLTSTKTDGSSNLPADRVYGVEVNVYACTSIGKVFGGGYGENAKVIGDTHVYINMFKGYVNDQMQSDIGRVGMVFGGGNAGEVKGDTRIDIGTATVYKADNETPEDIGVKIQSGDYVNPDATKYATNNTTSVVAGVYGGGMNAKVDGKTMVNIGTAAQNLGVYIDGNIYGGGQKGDVTGNTEVNICATKKTDGTYEANTLSTAGVTITGNVYGGGMGDENDVFECRKAMVGIDGTNSATNNNSSTYANYGTHVRIGNGTIGNGTTGGNVYGGGEIGRVEFHTEVVIGLGEGTGAATKSPVINGSVFGAGKGTNTHGYSGLVRGDSRVTIQGDAKVGHSVYGGGEMASVGKYEVVNGLPKTPLFGGKCTVTIGGYAEIGPDGMKMDNSATTGKPDDTGHVFGAGKGTLPYENVTGTPWSMQPTGQVKYDNNYTPGTDGLGYEAAYYKFIQSLGLASNTDVTIGGHAFVKGSVYGGSENGYVQTDTHVTIAGGQIGEGQNQTTPYADADFIDPSTTTVTTSKALATCATWTYDKETTGVPYDKYADETGYDSKGGAVIATDGHTYYGNVFGGGRGVVPFAAGKWHRAAGSVGGNTQVDITAGHILSSVYGGNENTDVGSYALGTDGEPTTTLEKEGTGTCTINISGGTVGVPRTKEQIDDNPVIGNVFGAGKGDKRVLFNTWTNVGATSVNISGTATIYGSVFGGGEDGHVIGNAVSNIGGTVTTGIGNNTTNHSYSKVVIGSTGISGADGNVFGGGRGSETALTAGVVGGNANLTVYNGNILGSVYGGGRLASVGTNFVNPENTSLYGVLQTPAADHGNTVVTINGGTIGLSNSTGVNGNIYGGSKGTTSDFRLGIVRSTTINMTGGTAYASVYGGGELAQVVGSHTTTTGGQAYGTEINISGGTIGIEGKGGATYGNVYGGGKGNTTHVGAGLIKTNTKISISETDGTNKPTKIWHNIYGGGAYGSVGDITRDAAGATYVPGKTAVLHMPTSWADNTGKAEVYIIGGQIGFNGNENGMVFGSSRGDVGTPGDGVDPNDSLAWVKETIVEIGTLGSTAGPDIRGSVYGSGENGHVFADTQVKIHSGKIGIDADTPTYGTQKITDTSDGKEYTGADYPKRGNVYGGGCGEDNYPGTTEFNPLAGIVLGNAKVTIDGGKVVHNVYGAGALGSVGRTNADGTTSGGKTTIEISRGQVGDDGDGDGNVYGAARGKLGLTQTNIAQVRETSVTVSQSGAVKASVYGGGEAGAVQENSTVKISGGSVGHNVYGGGNLGNVGTFTETEDGRYVWTKGGLSTVEITGGKVGPDNNTDTKKGNVFGAGQGKDDTFKCEKAMVRATNVSITKGTVNGSVFGGGEIGRVEYNTQVKIGDGAGTEGVTKVPNITGSVYGGGAGVATHGYSALVRGNTTVFVEGNAEVGHSVYGGGEIASVGRYGLDAEKMPSILLGGGYCYVTVQGRAVVGSDVFGAGKGVVAKFDKSNIDKTMRSRRMTLYTNSTDFPDGEDGTTWERVEAGAALTPGSTLVWQYFQDEPAYLEYLKTLALATHPELTIDGNSSIKGSVFGGGEEGITKGSVIVNIKGGTIAEDVYGGGALANTNTTSSVGKKDANDVPIKDSEGNIETETVHPTTTVNLLGGYVKGDAYGGGLGDLAARGTGHSDIAAMVYGDVFVTLGDEAATNATAFNISKYAGTDVVKSGRVFGCNNLNGSPKGNVTVTVNKTVSRDADGGIKAKPTLDTKTYEVAAVYGGGNLADYKAPGKKPKVIINSCDVSIEEVYGGGNAAEVPETDVLVMGAYEIENVFGGGNGEDDYTLDGGTTWITNPGANVQGNANTILKGGYIHAGYGGSNSKGTIYGNASINKDSGGKCPLNVIEIYGAGKDADVEGDLILVMGCSETRTEAVYGCSMNANVKGNVELTITSGEYGKVFGGNNVSGAIFGHIIVNIEETGCSPIIIDELYGCGNDAAYSTYGYWQNGTIDGTPEGKPKYVARTSATDHADAIVTFEGKPHTVPPYADPVVNVISATRIGKVFGGGLGSNATVYGNPKVNINMIKGAWAGKTYGSGESAVVIPDQLGEIGDVFGGGNAANVEGNTSVNIGTATTVDLIDLDADNRPVYETDGETLKTTSKNVEGANIVGNVYGGGNLADVGKYDVDNDKVDMTGNTYVNIGAVQDATDVTKYVAVKEGTSKVIVTGNVFGGGKGSNATFKCEKAMVTGGTNVCIGNGTIGNFDANGKLLSGGFVFGGGEVGRVEENTRVTIGIGDGDANKTSAPVIGNDVFGAGKGEKTHGYAALVRGNTYVTIQGDAKLKESVYGGGEIASVGRYNVVKASDLTDEFKQEHPELEVGMPWSLANSTSGNCYVVVRGNAEIGPDTPMKMTADGGPDDTGHVFGAGKGVLPYEGYSSTDPSWHVTATPWRMQPNNKKEEYGDGTNAGTEAKYLAYIETLALATQTDVTISGNAFVKGSVYGGSENGHVQHSTHVTIAGGQIGAGEGMNERYTGWPTETEDITTSWKECAHWDYDPMDAAPWDPYATYKNPADGKSYYDAAYTQTAEGGFHIAKDGHSFYGNVYGGGSGLIPYAPGKWHRAAGSVGGNTTVDITGGHILTSVYGGNEQTDVGTYKKDDNGALVVPVRDGKCTINMTGGTIGVPRTAEDTKKLPVNSYLFGAGKGDPRIFFNTWTNVIETEVNISGDARIYGSSFGGGEDGHVINNAVTNIGGTVVIGTGTAAKTYTENGVLIGSTGLSYVDGNVFGGGRGFTGDAQTAGTVGGNVVVNFSGGKILGSVYGGGRLASVGTLFTAPDHDNYGNFQEDKDAAGKSYGHVTINISGGTIGRDFTKITPVPEGAEHSGNVFGGSMGRLDLLNGTRNPIWPKMAQVKTSAVNVYGTAEIKRNVFGGGELGSVRDNASVVIGGYLNPNVSDGSKTTFIVNPSKNDSTITVPASDNAPIVCRDVYGGGYGSKDRTHTIFSVKEPNSSNGYDLNTYAFTPMQFAGCVGRNTFVDIKGGQVRKSVYGGGEMASVGIINCQVETLASPGANRIFVGQKDGKDYYHTSIFKNEDKQTVDGKEVVYGFALSWPFKFSYMPGFYGGTHVNITGGRIGAKTSDPDIQTDNGDVYGAGEGIAGDYKEYAFCANVGATDVNINMNSDGVTATNFEGGGNCISGAVYGGGENGHVMGDTRLTLVNGFVGHSIYGAGSGKGKFETELVKIGKDPASAAKEDHYKREIYSVTAGKVFGNSTINMSGGTVIRNVYGGGNMGSVGKGNYSGGLDDYSTAGYGETLNGNLWDNVSDDSKAFLSTGICTVNITGGTIGYIDSNDPSNTMYPWNSDSSLPYGNVFGGCRGESAPNIAESPRYLYSPEFFIGYVNETNVTIGADDGSGPTILGSVYGGGMDGHVRRDASVTIKGGEIGVPFNDANKAILGNDPDHLQWLSRGNVYGSGSGIGKYEYDFNYDKDFDDIVNYNNGRATVATKERDYSSSAGSVTRFTMVMVNGGTIHRNVYAGGSLSSIGAPKIGQSYLEYRKGDTTGGVGKQTLNQVVISGGNIGDKDSNDAGYGGHVFGGSRGDASLDNSTFSTSMFTDVAVKGGKVFGSVFGGGEVGIVKGSVDVNVTGGEVVKDVYGGGALANTNTENPKDADGKLTSTSTYTTTVNLLGGTINDAFGGGLGQKKDVNGDSDIEAKVYGDVTVNLNGLEPADYVPAIHSALVTDVDDTEGTYYRATGGCVVTGDVFGCNNYNGTPEGHAKVHVFKTVPKPGQVADGYDVDHVFGGGNDADYTPAASDTKQSTEVIIEGCDLTSIYQVYGGGNAAASPGTSVLVKGTKIIYEVFGGGNGESTETFENPGANVGYHTDKTEYTSGDGKSQVQLMAGNVTYAYGGSNSHGNIRGGSSVTNVTNEYSAGCCDKMTVQEIYAGGKNADMEGGAKIVMGCTNSDDWVEEVYAGAKNANVGGDVSLTLTSGKFGRVFGGNKESGILDGSITVNIEENAKCGVPLIIGELYGGGNKAAYSIYGYNADGTVKTSGEKLHASPVVNVRAFTSIGNIFGGGYGEKAVMYGSPTININVVNNNRTTGSTISTELTKTFEEGTDNEYSVKIPTHVDGKIGAINNVFGGGNAAKIYGDTNVNIGTEAKQKLVVIKDSGDPDYESDGVTPKTQEMDVVGADIRGNVYGGGNNAEVTGNTNVVIGTDGTSTTTTP